MSTSYTEELSVSSPCQGRTSVGVRVVPALVGGVFIYSAHCSCVAMIPWWLYKTTSRHQLLRTVARNTWCGEMSGAKPNGQTRASRNIVADKIKGIFTLQHTDFDRMVEIYSPLITTTEKQHFLLSFFIFIGTDKYIQIIYIRRFSLTPTNIWIVWFNLDRPHIFIGDVA
jgi:hypothetical protein